MKKIAYKSLIINPKDNKEIGIFNPGYLLVDELGKIIQLTNSEEKFNKNEFLIKDYTNFIILPGLVDTHAHLPQYAFSGIGNLPLLPWLEKYTFPHESRFANDDVARIESNNFFKSCLKNGTTTVVAYVTSHKSATNIAFEVADQLGIRAFLGKVLMDQNSPKELIHDKKTEINDCIDLIHKWHNKNNLEFVVTPRFAISCSEDLLRESGKLSQEMDLILQTHISENLDEIKFVRELYPWSTSYTDVYYQTGCLTSKSLMGHSIYLSRDELNLFKQQNSNVTHCPTSNRFLSSGVMRFREIENMGIQIGLGTDVAGGYNLSMIHEIKETIETSKTNLFFHSNSNRYSNLSIEEGLYYGTLGGAKILGKENEIGNFEKGKKADFIVINDSLTEPIDLNNLDLYLSPLEKLSRLIYRNHPDMVHATYVGGNLVYAK